MDDGQPDRYTLFVAMTKPAVNRFGIPQNSWVFVFVFTILFAWWVGRGTGRWQPAYYFIGIPLFFGARALTEWDHNWMRILTLWFMTKAKGLGRPDGAQLSPLPHSTPRRIRDIAGAL